MKREEAIQVLQTALTSPFIYGEYADAIEMAIKAIRHDVIFEQIKWERDVALDTLEEHGIGLGQKAQNVYNLHKGDLISREDAIDAICKTWCYTTYNMCPHVDDGYCKGCDEIEAVDALPSAEYSNAKTQNSSQETQKLNGDLISREEVLRAIITAEEVEPDFGYKHLYDVIELLPSVDTVCEDIQTEERAKFVAKETELAHIEAKLENMEKRFQSAWTANFVAEQLDRLRKMTDDEKLEFLKRFFGMEGGAE